MLGPCLLSLLLALAAPALHPARSPEGGPQMVNGQPRTPPAIDGRWRVVEVEGVAVPPGITIDMAFAAGMVSGTAGCAGFRATTAIADGNLGLGMVSHGPQDCDDEVMAAGSGFVRALGLSGRYEIGADGRLTLYSSVIPLVVAVRP